MKIILIFCLIFLQMQLVFGIDVNEPIFRDKRVLFISSYSPSFETFFKQIEGIRSVLDKKDIVLDIEFMDSKRFYTEENYENFYDTLKYKIENLDRYDAIIVGDDNALIFVNEHKELFQNTPIIFLGINDIEQGREISKDANITGFYESVSLAGTIDLAYQLKPESKRVIAIVDATYTGQAVKRQYDLLSENYEELIFETMDLSKMSFTDFQLELSKASENDILLLIAARRDITSETVSFRESVSKIFESTNQPVFCLYDFGLNHGLIGGEVISFYDQGKKAAEIAVSIFNGEAIETIEPVMNTHSKILDYSLIEKYELSIDDLDEDVEFTNRDVSVLQQYLPYIILGLAVILLEAILIVYLFYSIRLRRKAEKEILNKKKELLSSNEELEIMNEEILASNEELTMSNEKLTNAIVTIEKQKKEIYDLIYLDDLTSLKNRLAMSEIIDQWIGKQNKEYSYSILFLDVDNFKMINDTFGHDFGDRIIIETGKRISSLESENLQLGRFGGDEFLFIFKFIETEKLSELLVALEDLFKDPFTAEGRSLFLTISVGVSISPIHGVDSKELIKKADMALYDAKNSGKNRCIIYNQSMIEELEEKVLFQSHVRKAFNNREFYLNYQPHYDLSRNKFTGVEALIRWKSSELGQVSPLKLIEAAEEMGLIVDIGRWVMKEACLFAKRVNEEAIEKVTIAINISSVQMVHPSFLKDLQNIINETDVNPEYICLEMTETTIFEFPEGNEYILDKIKWMGIGIALDDFGTGYSSLSYFKDIPASVIKIDKVFIDNMADDEFDRHTVKMIIDLAHHKNLVVIAEGIEDEEQLNVLKQMNCDIIQGYYFSKPLMASEAFDMLTKNE